MRKMIKCDDFQAFLGDFGVAHVQLKFQTKDRKDLDKAIGQLKQTRNNLIQQQRSEDRRNENRKTH